MFGKQDRLTGYDPVKFRKKIQVIIWLVSLAFFPPDYQAVVSSGCQGR